MSMPSASRPLVSPPRLLLATAAVALAAAGFAARADDGLKALQTRYAANGREHAARAYHFGSQGPGDVFSNHASHSNRLIPFYTFGSTLDPAPFTGKNSLYRDEAKIKALYGSLPANTLNPEAEYCDQSDLRRMLRAAVDRGAKHLFIVWFDGLDWPTTQAAAVVKTGRIYREGKGSGLIFQDYDARGTARFGYYVTAPTHDQNIANVDAQSIAIARAALSGGYDAAIAGPNPWTLGPLGPRAPGYIKGQSANAADKASIAAVGRVAHAYTDSAPSAAEAVSGVKSYNNGINVDERGRCVPTLFHEVQAQGWRVGTATSVPFDHASPAAMYAHNVHRDDYQDLARDMLGLASITQATHREPQHPGLDVVLGAGFGQTVELPAIRRRQGANARPDNLYIAADDLKAIDADNGGKYVVATTRDHVNGSAALLEAARRAATEHKRLFGLFGSKKLSHLPYRTADGGFDPAPGGRGRAEVYEPDELAANPTLADMTRAALDVLSAEPKRPFALFVEAGDVDFALHDNNLDDAVGAVYSGEDAVRAIIDWVEKHSDWNESALVVAADHGHYLVIDDLEALAKIHAAAAK